MGIKTVMWDLTFGAYESYLMNTDSRVKKWTMVDTPILNTSIIVLYVIFVVVVGPRLMQGRKPFDLRSMMIPYNIALVILNLFICFNYIRILLFADDDQFGCAPLTVSESVHGMELAEITWWFFISKYAELSDTIFFVLRKKEQQLSKLHLVHHSTIPLVIWALLRYQPGGYNSIFPLLNSFVHTVMYTYYCLTAFGYNEKEQLWFKKYITMTQMIQFILVLTYFFGRPFLGCKISAPSFAFNIFIAGFFFILFCNFYRHAYLKDKEESSLKDGKRM